MAEGVLGLGGGGSAALSQDVIDKLKAAERKGRVEPFEKSLEDWDEQLIKVTAIEAKVTELLSASRAFDLFGTGANAFEQMSASTTGTSAVFDAVDVGSLVAGTISVVIGQLAQKDVHGSTTAFSDKEATITTGTSENLSVNIDGTDYDFSIDDKTYQELADEINLNAKLTASIEQVGDSSYKLVIKSTDSGTANDITITTPASAPTGLDAFTESLNAQNLTATIDGIDYDVSSNTITTQGNLDVTAIELGTSTISIQRDTSQIVTNVEALMTAYNELVDLIDAEAYDVDSPIEDIDTLQSMMASIKDMLFADYNTVDADSSTDQNVFNVGFELDKSGHMTLDTTVFAAALSSDFDLIEALFIGVAEDEGLGTALKSYIDEIQGYDGLLTNYDEHIIARKTTLEEDRDEAIEDLDNKYKDLSAQFAAYGGIIAQFEASFGGLKMMIDQSISG
ncbi:MAG: flagellar filament capping protein FliD [Campylobacteraceae bacterium]|nr:flagellar filament capping protein FliD [Campylobacteraceae bacterium]